MGSDSIDPINGIRLYMAPDERNVFSSLIQVKMMILVLESNRKNNRKRRPILARRQ